MNVQPLHEGAGSVFARAPSRRDTPALPPQDIQAFETELQDGQDGDALEAVLELIEMRYQQHLAHAELQALFEAGELCC